MVKNVDNKGNFVVSWEEEVGREGREAWAGPRVDVRSAPWIIVRFVRVLSFGGLRLEIGLR
jgi:hypothetical protein